MGQFRHGGLRARAKVWETARLGGSLALPLGAQRPGVGICCDKLKWELVRSLDEAKIDRGIEGCRPDAAGVEKVVPALAPVPVRSDTNE